MPAAIPVVLSYAASYAGSALVAGWVSTALTIASVVSSVALASSQKRKAESQARDAYNAGQVDRLVNIMTTVAPRELVLGRVRKGGAVYFRGSAGELKETFVAHLALAGHEIDAVEQVYLNDQPVTVDSEGRVLEEPYHRVFRQSLKVAIPPGETTATLSTDPIEGTVSLGLPVSTRGTLGDGESLDPPTFTLDGRVVTLSAPYSSGIVYVNYQADVHYYYARIRWELGSSTAVADSRTKALFPDLWTDNHQAQGVAKLVAEFTMNEGAFPTQSVPNLTAVIRGAKVYDPRTATTAWSENPALLARHVYAHPYFGKATVSSDEDTRFIAAANACDVTHGYVVSGVTDTQPIYRAGLVAPYGTPAASLLDDLSQAMAGMWALAGGELYLRAGVYTAPVMTLTDADLAVIQRKEDQEEQDGLSISVHRERADKFNTVNLRIWDEDQGYKEVALAPVKSSALITRDGGELAQEMVLPAVFYAPQAQHIAGVAMRDARDPLVFEAPWKLRTYPLELFDTVQVTLARYGWTDKTLMLVGKVWDPERGVVRLTMKETSAAIFAPDAAFLPQGYAENTALPNPWDIDPPVLSEDRVYSGTDELVAQADGTILTRVRVTWDAVPDQSVADGQIELQWKPADADEWQSVTVPGDATQGYILGAQDGASILIRARSVTDLATSNWSLQIAHSVIGKTAPPSDVATFSIRGSALEWPAVSDADLAGYEVRFNYGNNTTWGTATALHAGVITDSPWTPQIIPPGQITLLIKAKDTSGNYSANAAAIVANIGDVILDNLILSYDDKAAGFPGTKTNCAVSLGNLLANDSGDLFWGDDNGNFWGASASAFWPTATYLQLGYEFTYTVGASEAGSRLTVDVDVAAESYTIEYRYDSQDLFWGDAADPFWGTASATFWPPLTEWRAWPGELLDVPAGAIQFRITTQAGTTRGTVSTLTLQFDVEDEMEELDDVAISAAGTRLPITKTYRSINNIQLTLQADGGTATSARWVDKDEALGPLVQCINSAGTAVAGTLDARIQGVKG